MLTRFVRIQLAIFTIASIVGVLVMVFTYMQVPTLLGIGRITVTLELPASGGLYRFSNVTYRGVQVGKVTKMDVSRTMATATLSLATSPKIPADLQAEVRSISAVGEQYVELLPRTDAPPYLQDGSVIPMWRTKIPQAVGPMLDQVSTLINSIPKDDLSGLLDESFKAFNGSGFDLGSLFDSSAQISADLNRVGDRSSTLIEDSGPLLDAQATTADSLRTWASSLAGITGQVVTNDPEVRTLLQEGPPAADEVSRLFDQIKPTLPILLANLTTFGQVGVTYHPSLEQVLVLLPPFVANVLSSAPENNPTGIPLGDFRVEIGDGPPCTVGFLPPSQWRSPADTTTVDTPDGLYCKLPQDAPIVVRGARNSPCMGVPGKRAPTVQECYSDKPYTPLAMRQHITGPYPFDPNLVAQGIPPDSRAEGNERLYTPTEGTPLPPGAVPSGTPPQGPPPGAPPLPLPPEGPPPPPEAPAPADAPQAGESPPPGDAPPPPQPGEVFPPLDTGGEVAATPSSFAANDSEPGTTVAVAHYDPQTGRYATPDGQVYRQSDLVDPARSWQDLVYRADQ
ncbi:virulence factor Mce [Mycolicibacterium agri]|uniref:Mammalian cell entry protein n=1 Tax=Mycolicibacterium agri TaxID=36811 RepID=A0A2A7N1K3_MYCAG|nr:MlaD family protein [Mycolicibacterium agri]PEG37663.1 virulence factor Mce [Mycolicibacterium agri]GFG55646.1 mammalian cell entry protein [Mycolicibacterium agri]